ncbi:MAE_28990/MAE_18760 family HEPN-like nuclease [Teredinibacter turnerae]|uniref:MAE_28990/MAE_18760 family HEPN-like nuclease n=1 Tax=Teredinibacter turnerae TaxID=2426 RepID=UPI0005F78BDD|nr:MAE_28990/MAE_18760 family HEPN-like nuclease [Teredinibacter turnerae]
MPFSIVRSNSRERFGEVLINLAFIEENEGDGESSVEVKILRGLFYVHLYAALERAVNETIEQTILLVKQDGVKNIHYHAAFNLISLNSRMQAFKQCGSKNYFIKSAEVFEGLRSDEIFDLSDTVFLDRLQNIWYKTIQETLRSFGLESINIDPRVRLTIDEVVEKRNAVAHGRETPITVGERHRSDILRKKTQEIQLVVEQFIAVFEDYIINKRYLNSQYINDYLPA